MFDISLSFFKYCLGRLTRLSDKINIVVNEETWDIFAFYNVVGRTRVSRKRRGVNRSVMRRCMLNCARTRDTTRPWRPRRRCAQHSFASYCISRLTVRCPFWDRSAIWFTILVTFTSTTICVVICHEIRQAIGNSWFSSVRLRQFLFTTDERCTRTTIGFNFA